MITIRKNGLTRPFIHGDSDIILEERMDKHEKVLTLTYLNTVSNNNDNHHYIGDNLNFVVVVVYLD